MHVCTASLIQRIGDNDLRALVTCSSTRTRRAKLKKKKKAPRRRDTYIMEMASTRTTMFEIGDKLSREVTQAKPMVARCPLL